MKGQNLGNKQLNGSNSFNNSMSSIDKEQPFGRQESNINKTSSDMLNERVNYIYIYIYNLYIFIKRYYYNIFKFILNEYIFFI